MELRVVDYNGYYLVLTTVGLHRESLSQKQNRSNKKDLL